MILPRFAIKVSDLSSVLLNPKLTARILEQFDCIVYQAPFLACHFDPGIWRLMEGLKAHLIPHSNLLSLAHEEPLNEAILQALKKEIALVRPAFFAEHIGLLNPQSASAPTFGYLLPPERSQRSIENFGRNVRRLCEVVDTPVVLENPVEYASLSPQISWPDFLIELSRNLPSDSACDVDWLLDVAHMLVTCNNATNLKVEAFIEAYAKTGRKVRELHLSGIHRDGSGVWHDSHGSFLSPAEFEFVINSLRASQLNPELVTFETDVFSSSVFDELNVIKKILVGKDSTFTASSGLCTQPLQISPATVATVATIERKGRVNILQNRVRSQFFADDSAIEAICSSFGFPTVEKMAGELFTWMERGEADPLPSFDLLIGDPADVKWPVIQFLGTRSDSAEQLWENCFELFIDVASHFSLFTAFNGHAEGGDTVVLFENLADSENLDRGLFSVSLETDGSSSMEYLSENWNELGKVFEDRFKGSQAVIIVSQFGVEIQKRKGGIWLRKLYPIRKSFAKTLLQRSHDLTTPLISSVEKKLAGQVQEGLGCA